MKFSGTVFLFSGQGSHHFHMGAELFEKNETFRKWMRQLDEQARPLLGESVLESVYSKMRRKGDPFTRTTMTHPAIFMVQYSLTQTLIRQGISPDMVLGASLGSFAAAAVGGFIGLEDALTAVVSQAKAVEDACVPGGMTAVMGPHVILSKECGASEIAAVNFASHFVLSGRDRDLAQAEDLLAARSTTFQRLPVSLAFHSQWIDAGRTGFDSFMKSITCRRGQVPLVSSADAAMLSSLPDGFFWDAIRRPVMFQDTISRLEQQGPYRYVDVGPAGTMATFLKYCLSAETQSKAYGILTLFGTDERGLRTVLDSIPRRSEAIQPPPSRVKTGPMTAFVFPGQGSQKRGMGQGLFDEVREYAAIEKEVDGILGYSLRALCLEDPNNQLRETKFTQPCLYAVNALHYYQAASQGLRPDYLAGHSLGEFNALLAAGVFDFLTGLRLVQKRGELMSQAKAGGMAAVIGLTPEKIVAIVNQNGLTSIDVANFNSPTQTVISGPTDEIKRVEPIFQKAGATMYMPLSVSAAFHSRYMGDAATAFANFLKPIQFSSPRIPLISNAMAKPYPENDASESVKEMLVKQMTHSVLWVQSIRYLMSQGVSQFSEMGPGNTLTKLVQQIQHEQATATVS